jgi:hypothetical protein
MRTLRKSLLIIFALVAFGTMFAFFSNGNWIIANPSTGSGPATLQVIDLNGRILSSETINGSVSKAIEAVPGAYVIRLINADDVKAQKIVVR